MEEKTKKEIHEYWKQPWDGRNQLNDYVKGEKRSIYLSEKIDSLVSKDCSILEIGCNIGRNLNQLYKIGFENLTAIEIRKEAIDFGRKEYPNLADIVIHNVPVEDIIPEIVSDSFDLVYTMAVLEHIHSDSEFIFEHIAKITKQYLVIIEDELSEGWRHFPRNYRTIFESFGMHQIEEINCRDINIELSPAFFVRIFEG